MATNTEDLARKQKNANKFKTYFLRHPTPQQFLQTFKRYLDELQTNEYEKIVEHLQIFFDDMNLNDKKNNILDKNNHRWFTFMSIYCDSINVQKAVDLMLTGKPQSLR